MNPASADSGKVFHEKGNNRTKAPREAALFVIFRSIRAVVFAYIWVQNAKKKGLIS